MQITNKITFMGLLLAISTLNISGAIANSEKPINTKVSNPIEYRLSRLTKVIEKRGVETMKTLPPAEENLLARGFANRSGGGGFANRGGGGGFVNRGGGGGFVNRSPWPNGGSFYNRY